MIGYYNYTVILTYLGTVSGFVGITFVGNGNLRAALICLMISGFCDMFDGKIASTMDRTKQEKRFGIQIDSLSDLICFGVLPAMIGLSCSGKGYVHIVISALFMLCALIRLAWFNVDEEERQDRESGGREVYMGLPVTSSALLFPFLIGLGELLNISLCKASPWVLICIAAAFITPFKMKKPGLCGKLIVLAIGVASLVLVLIGVKV